MRGGVLTGGVKINISHGGKGKQIKKIFSKFGIKASETIVIGDSEGDIPMVKIAGYSIAFNSTSSNLSNTVDYNCKTLDFMEVGEKIKELL